MCTFRLFSISLLTLSLAIFVGCKPAVDAGKDKAKDKDKNAKIDDDHDHGPGPHGGTIVDFGKWHAEFTVDHKGQEATVYLFGGDAKTPAPIGAEKLLLSVKSPSFQVDLVAAPDKADPTGKSSRFAAKHANFAKEQDFEGILSGTVEGKNYSADFKEEDHKKEEKKKK